MWHFRKFAPLPLVAIVALGGCVQIEPGYIEGPRPQIAERDVQVFEPGTVPAQPYTFVDELIVDYRWEDRDSMIREMRQVAGDRGANAIILDRDFPTVDGYRNIRGLYLYDPEKKTGGKAIYIGTPPPPKYIRPL